MILEIFESHYSVACGFRMLFFLFMQKTHHYIECDVSVHHQKHNALICLNLSFCQEGYDMQKTEVIEQKMLLCNKKAIYGYHQCFLGSRNTTKLPQMLVFPNKALTTLLHGSAQAMWQIAYALLLYCRDSSALLIDITVCACTTS